MKEDRFDGVAMGAAGSDRPDLDGNGGFCGFADIADLDAEDLPVPLELSDVSNPHNGGGGIPRNNASCS
jgi:hypothetical protein